MATCFECEIEQEKRSENQLQKKTIALLSCARISKGRCQSLKIKDHLTYIKKGFKCKKTGFIFRLHTQKKAAW